MTLVQGLLAMSLAAPSIHAQTPAAVAAKPAASAIDPASIQALKDMGAFLQTLKRFQVSTELTGERVLADGQKLQHAATADMDVERPNKVRVLMRSARSAARAGVRRQDGHALYPCAEVLLDRRTYRHDRQVDRPAAGTVRRGASASRISFFGARRSHRSTRSNRR
jgi:hypothetical protein